MPCTGISNLIDYELVKFYVISWQNLNFNFILIML